MKLGNIEINKAYYGNIELTHSNAYLGTVPIIKDTPIPTVTYPEFIVRYPSYSSSTKGTVTENSNNYIFEGGTALGENGVNIGVCFRLPASIDSYSFKIDNYKKTLNGWGYLVCTWRKLKDDYVGLSNEEYIELGEQPSSTFGGIFKTESRSTVLFDGDTSYTAEDETITINKNIAFMEDDGSWWVSFYSYNSAQDIITMKLELPKV